MNRRMESEFDIPVTASVGMWAEAMHFGKTTAPSFWRFVEDLYRRDPLQKKAIERFLATRDRVYWGRAEAAAVCLTAHLEEAKVPLDEAVNAYVRMCRDMLREQIKFAKTGCYSARSSCEARDGLYRSEGAMSAYMYGLALSLFLWPNHYAMYDFFIRTTDALSGVTRYLEVGPGHGLFLLHALTRFPRAEFRVVDVSPVAVAMSKRLVARWHPDRRCHFEIKDINQYEGGGFDYIVMGEVLEHLDDPMTVLQKLRGFLSPGARCYLTTCANCPAVDHVYLFRDAEDIRTHLVNAGLRIVEDIALPIANLPTLGPSEAKVGVNYAAMLERGGG